MKVKDIIFLLLASCLLLVWPGGVHQAAGQPSLRPADTVIRPERQLSVPPPKVRTWSQMEAARSREAGGPAPPVNIPFRPTINEDDYKAAKTKAGRTKALQAPEARIYAPQVPGALTETINFEGAYYLIIEGYLNPPDTHGAVGLSHFVEITNSHLDIYEKAAPNNRVGSMKLSAFLGYTAQLLYDPRVIYDPYSHRWIISSISSAESPSVQYFFFAVSQTADPLGAYYVYQVNVSNGIGGIWDFPQLGQDRQALIFTANFYNAASVYIDSRMFTVAKSLVYNGPGQTLTPQMFTGLSGTLAPPLVLDDNPKTFLVAADTTDNKVFLYTLANSGGNPPALSGPAPIAVPAYSMPPNALQAPQPTIGFTLDTSDSRFVNASTQIGNSLFQVHAINSGGFARCRFYEFDTLNLKIIQSGDFGSSSTSYDFNAAIAANRHKDVFVTWTSTDPANNVNAEVRYSARLHTDPPGVIPSPGMLLFGSATYYSAVTTSQEQRWGDYSAVSLDPADNRGLTAWIVNERILSNGVWGSRIGRIGFTPTIGFLPSVYDLLLLD